jgi:hypothetical protein
MQADDVLSWEFAGSTFGIIMRPRSGLEAPTDVLEELPPFVANDVHPALSNRSIYDVPATAAPSMITLPEPASLVAPPSTVFFSAGPLIVVFADGVKNAHTVQYRTPTKLLTPPLFASKRHVARLAAFQIQGEAPCWACFVFGDFDPRALPVLPP